MYRLKNSIEEAKNLLEKIGDTELQNLETYLKKQKLNTKISKFGSGGDFKLLAFKDNEMIFTFLSDNKGTLYSASYHDEITGRIRLNLIRGYRSLLKQIKGVL